MDSTKVYLVISLRETEQTMIFLVYLLFMPSWVFGHEHRRYSGTIGTKYNTSSWDDEKDFDSVGQCGTFCTYNGCSLFTSMLSGRGFRCKFESGSIK